MTIYLHETIPVISGQMEAYFDGMKTEGFPVFDEWRLKMVGFWQVNYSSGLWPEAVVMWEIESWDDYVWQMKDALTNAGLARWMQIALQWRPGGFDRILLPVSWSPKPPVRPTFKSTGGIFFHQSFSVCPGEAKLFLDAMERNVLPKLPDSGLELELFIRNIFDPLEYIGIWSVPDWEGYAKFQALRAADDEGSQLPGLTPVWKHLTGIAEKVLLPCAYSPLGGGTPSSSSPM